MIRIIVTLITLLFSLSAFTQDNNSNKKWVVSCKEIRLSYKEYLPNGEFLFVINNNLSILFTYDSAVFNKELSDEIARANNKHIKLDNVVISTYGPNILYNRSYSSGGVTHREIKQENFYYSFRASIATDEGRKFILSQLLNGKDVNFAGIIIDATEFKAKWKNMKDCIPI